MRNNRLIVYFAIVILIIVVYAVIASQHREDLGQLEIFEYTTEKKYCNYIIKSYSVDAGFYKIGDKVCIVCDDKYPTTKDVCYSRITFTSASGLVVYTADLDETAGKICYACTDAKGYYKVP